jgi:hypothetical protein
MAGELKVGDRVRCKDDGELGRVIDTGYCAVRVHWDDGLESTHLAHDDPVLEKVDTE